MQFFAATTTILALASAALAADVGSTGELSTLDAGLKGTVTVKDANTLEISGYTLEDASAPALYWWGSETEDLSAGFRINTEQVTTEASGETVDIALDAGYTADQFMYVGLWCERLDVNFGQAKLEGGSEDAASTTGSEDASETTSSDESAETTEDNESGAGRVGAGAMVAAAAFAALLV